MGQDLEDSKLFGVTVLETSQLHGFQRMTSEQRQSPGADLSIGPDWFTGATGLTVDTRARHQHCEGGALQEELGPVSRLWFF